MVKLVAVDVAAAGATATRKADGQGAGGRQRAPARGATGGAGRTLRPVTWVDHAGSDSGSGALLLFFTRRRCGMGACLPLWPARAPAVYPAPGRAALERSR